ncbi:MAG TPA: SCO family protein [Acidimicrobiales bacterium]|nr:SCO family protein [Acidimicrobiales bacterium]
MNLDVDQPGPDADPSAAPPVVDRAAAFRTTPPPVPRRFFTLVLAAAAVLGLGGLGAERLFSSSGLNQAPVPPQGVATPRTVPVPVPAGPSRALSASLPSFMGLTPTVASATPVFRLIDQHGQTFSLGGPASKAVVLTFFNGPCNDICPVVAAALKGADADLGAAATNVEFITVNTDPTALATSASAPAQAASSLGTETNWRFLTGPLSTLDAVWKSYGVAITVVEATGAEVHNNVMYFIDPRGHERYRALPFADESRTGAYSLPSSAIARWGDGIATYAATLVGP